MTNIMRTKYTRKTTLQRTLNYLLTGFTEAITPELTQLEEYDTTEFPIHYEIASIANTKPGCFERFTNKFSSLVEKFIYRQELNTVSPADNLEFESSIHIRKPQVNNGNHLKYLDQPKFIE